MQKDIQMQTINGSRYYGVSFYGGKQTLQDIIKKRIEYEAQYSEEVVTEETAE